MPEWLIDDISSDQPLSAGTLIVRLGAALLFGTVVALVYRTTHGREKVDSAVLTTTLVLLAVLIAMVSMVIGNSVARAFSLVGALSIVRFRTVVDDTRDTAFVIFAVIVGMAVGAGLYLVPVIGIPIVSLPALVLARRSPTSQSVAEGTLSLRMGLGHSAETHVLPLLVRHGAVHRLMAIATARQGAALDVTYSVRLPSEEAMSALVAEFNRTEGVQSVEWSCL